MVIKLSIIKDFVRFVHFYTTESFALYFIEPNMNRFIDFELVFDNKEVIKVVKRENTLINRGIYQIIPIIYDGVLSSMLVAAKCYFYWLSDGFNSVDCKEFLVKHSNSIYCRKNFFWKEKTLINHMNSCSKLSNVQWKNSVDK